MSYSAWSAKAPALEDLTFPEWVEQQDIQEMTLGGLCLDFCVGLSAIDVREKANIDVIVAVDATRSITEQGARDMLTRFKQVGVQVATTAEIIQEIQKA